MEARGVDLLWTGGWDSTFRLLQLVLVHRVAVVPHYLADPSRPSTGTELGAMAHIRGRLFDDHPHTRALVRPLRVAAVDRLGAHPDLARALQRLRAQLYIGDQYAWLPAYCREQGIAGMELGVHLDDRVRDLLQRYVARFDHPAGFRSVRVADVHAGTPEHALFGAFSFPLFDIDKRGIQREAAAAGWGELMELTWFCHVPVRGQPCGRCAPCRYTIDEGLGRRIPAARRLASWGYRRLAWPLLSQARQLRAALGPISRSAR